MLIYCCHSVSLGLLLSLRLPWFIVVIPSLLIYCWSVRLCWFIAVPSLLIYCCLSVSLDLLLFIRLSWFIVDRSFSFGLLLSIRLSWFIAVPSLLIYCCRSVSLVLLRAVSPDLLLIVLSLLIYCWSFRLSWFIVDRSVSLGLLSSLLVNILFNSMILL